jgi:hypothetical protein
VVTERTPFSPSPSLPPEENTLGAWLAIAIASWAWAYQIFSKQPALPEIYSLTETQGFIDLFLVIFFCLTLFSPINPPISYRKG